MARHVVPKGMLVALTTYAERTMYPSLCEEHGILWIVQDDVGGQDYLLKSLRTGEKVFMKRKFFVRSDGKGNKHDEGRTG